MPSPDSAVSARLQRLRGPVLDGPRADGAAPPRVAVSSRRLSRRLTSSRTGSESAANPSGRAGHRARRRGPLFPNGLLRAAPARGRPGPGGGAPPPGRARRSAAGSNQVQRYAGPSARHLDSRQTEPGIDRRRVQLQRAPVVPPRRRRTARPEIQAEAQVELQCGVVGLAARPPARGVPEPPSGSRARSSSPEKYGQRHSSGSSRDRPVVAVDRGSGERVDVVDLAETSPPVGPESGFRRTSMARRLGSRSTTAGSTRSERWVRQSLGGRRRDHTHGRRRDQQHQARQAAIAAVPRRRSDARRFKRPYRPGPRTDTAR